MVRCVGEAVLDPIRSRGPTTLRDRSVRRSKLDRWASHRRGERDHDLARRRGEPTRHWPAALSNATSDYGSELRPAAETKPPVRTASEIDPENGPQWQPTGGRQSRATLIHGLPQKLRRNMRGRNRLPRTRRKTGQSGPFQESLPITTTVPCDITKRPPSGEYLLAAIGHDQPVWHVRTLPKWPAVRLVRRHGEQQMAACGSRAVPTSCR